MQTILNSLSHDPGILLAAILGSLGILTGLTITVTAIVAGHWRKVRQTEEMNALKHTLLSQGMSADEIATVVNAMPGRRPSPLIAARRNESSLS